jgi:hypothetical protein
LEFTISCHKGKQFCPPPPPPPPPVAWNTFRLLLANMGKGVELNLPAGLIKYFIVQDQYNMLEEGLFIYPDVVVKKSIISGY